MEAPTKTIRVYLADKFHPDLRTGLTQKGFECIEGAPLSEEKIDNAAMLCPVCVISTKSKLTREVINRLERLILIARGGSGMDNIDVEYAVQRGITCINTPEGNRDSVAEHALGMMLALLHNFGAQQQVNAGKWNPHDNRPKELKDKTVAIIGYGNTGMALAKLLTVFGCRILAYDKYKSGFGDAFVQESNWNEIYTEADIISLHVPLTNETRHMINSINLGNFKTQIILINTSRGEVLETEPVLVALQNGQISGLGLDVVENENKFSDSALLKFLAKNKNLFEAGVIHRGLPLIITPHIAGKSYESQARIAHFLVQKIAALRHQILSN